jgi:iron complex outermembrane receptor protein
MSPPPPPPPSPPSLAPLSPPPAAPQSVTVTVTVTATRTATPAFDVPASIDRVGIAPDADGKPGVNLSESLGGVPGLQARDRQNYAQDVQISVRGFGARSTFGIRGVRLYVDGIPATLPDGQGQISNVDLGSAAGVEVLRGPFSALYGNSSGGVLQVFTEDGSGRPRLTVGAGTGSDGLRHTDAKLAGADGGFRYVVSGSHFQTDGYRDHSAARRDTANAKLSLRLDDASELTIIGNSVDLPMALDPLGLTRAGLAADPRAVDPSALAFDTRKSMNQTQGGLVYVRRFGADNELRAMVYDGERRTTQFQSVPVGAQGNPASPGGVIGLGRDYVGTDLRWTTRGTFGARGTQRFSLVGGLAWDRLLEHRRGYENYAGSGADQVLGVQGALRRDETNTVIDLDPYLQGEWHPDEAWTIDAGLRRSHVRFGSRDAYVTATNPDDSGGTVYTATLPVLGVLYALQPSVHLYATAGRGFETPTLNELAYRPNGLTGMNFALKPARSDNLEAGVKTRSAAWGEAALAFFYTRTSDEIVTLTNSGGRSSYQNAGATRRRGMELAWSTTLGGDLAARVAWTIVDARYRDAFLTCSASPCGAPNVPVAAGNRIPGIARETAFASLAWQPAAGWRGSLEARAASHVEVNDANGDAAAAFAIASASAGYVLPLGAWSLSGFARVDNLFDRRYVGSVIVNEGNARFFEPAAGRTVFAGVSGSYRF